jgi:hypothetical protein
MLEVVVWVKVRAMYRGKSVRWSMMLVGRSLVCGARMSVGEEAIYALSTLVRRFLVRARRCQDTRQTIMGHWRIRHWSLARCSGGMVGSSRPPPRIASAVRCGGSFGGEICDMPNGILMNAGRCP